MPKYSVVLRLEHIYDIEAEDEDEAVDFAGQLLRRGSRESYPLELTEDTTCSELPVSAAVSYRRKETLRATA